MIKNKILPAQALQYNLERLSNSIEWLEEIDKKIKKSPSNKLQLKKRILADIISIYVSALVDTTNDAISLVNCYGDHHEIIKNFLSLQIVKKCRLNRNKRSGHEDFEYGFFISSDMILKSDLKKWIEELSFFIVVTKINKKIDHTLDHTIVWSK